MGKRLRFYAVIAVSLLAQALSAPIPDQRFKRATDDLDNSINIEDIAVNDSTSSTTTTRDPFDGDDDDDEDFGPEPSTNGGGSNIFSLLRIATALFPGSGSANIGQKLLKIIPLRKGITVSINRQFINNKEIDYRSDLKTHYQKQENDENDFEYIDNNEEESEEEDSTENGSNDTREGSKQESDSNIDSSEENDGNESDYDSDEPPGGGDEGGGGILGLLAGLSGGEDGQSDLGSLLATVSGIVANLSGDGIDLNSLIASGIGLFVGLLSEGEENPGTVIASYLLTSLDTLTGGGANNNGEFFGKFLTKLVKGTSAAGDPDESTENDGNGMPMADSAGFIASFLMSLLGDMSKSSSGSSSHS